MPRWPICWPTDALNSRVTGEDRPESRKMFAVGNDPKTISIVREVESRREVAALRLRDPCSRRCTSAGFATGELRPICASLYLPE